MKEAPLQWAQQHAEMKARLLQSDENKRILVDSTAPWRARPASLKQICLLRKYRIPFEPEITSGEASDLIGKAKDARERSLAEKAANKGRSTPQAQKRARVSTS
jgi:hypothetical protein